VEIVEESMGFQINIYNIGLFQLLHVLNIDMCKNEVNIDPSTISEGGN
jgi:hypothetical protein